MSCTATIASECYLSGWKFRGWGCRSRAAAEDPKFISDLILPFALDVITANRLARRSSLDLGNGSDNLQGSRRTVSLGIVMLEFRME
jgi:hypothetical protein